MTRQEAQDLAAFHLAAVQAVGKGLDAARVLLEATVAQQSVDGAFMRYVKQFTLASIALERCILERELNKAGDWLCWSLTNEIADGQVQQVHVDRLWTFLEAQDLMATPVGHLLVRWLSHLFYYARLRAAMTEIAAAAFPMAVAVFKLGYSHQVGAAELGAMALGWAQRERPELTPVLLPALEEAANDESLPPSLRAPLVLALTGKAGDASRFGAAHWLEVARGQLFAHLDPSQRLHVLTDAYGRAATDEHFAALIAAVDELQAPLVGASQLQYRRLADAYADFSFAMIGASLDRGELDRALTLLAHWYGVPPDEREPPDSMMVFCPLHWRGFIAAWGGGSIRVERDQDAVLREVTDAGNLFLGVSNTVAEASAHPVHVPDRFGVPTAAHAPRYESALRQVYCPEGVTPDRRDTASQVVLRSQAQPYQAIQLKTWGYTWPISATLKRSRPDRPIANALLWSGGGSMTEEIELDAVRQLLEVVGIYVRVASPAADAKGEFVREYADARWDLLWLASHGEFDHWDPKTARVQIDRAHNYVEIDDVLGRAPAGPSRRFAVLNVCDGARSEELGLLPRVGFASAIAAPEQAVVSHLWPADGWAAATFGVLLAIELIRSRAYFPAFAAALDKMRLPFAQISDHLQAAGVGQSIAERLRRQADDNTLGFWGSPAFFQ